MSEKFKIAIAQPPISSSVHENAERVMKMMTSAQMAGSRLIHFPEGGLSGYVKAQITDWAEVDWRLLDSELSNICDHAGKLGIWVVLGANHNLGEDNRPFNSLYVISDSGDVHARYDKRYCSHTEITDWFSAGEKPTIFEIDGFRFGCALCIEIQFPEIFGEYRDLDVDAVLFSAYTKDQMFWIQAQAHAATNNYWISVSVPAQCGMDFPSGLIGPSGHSVARLELKETPDILFAEMDRLNPAFDVALTKARPWRRTARTGAIYEPKIKKR